MHKRTLVIMVLSALAVASVLFAHEGEEHAGPSWTGQVISKTAQSFLLKTAEGARTISVTNETKYEKDEQESVYADVAEGTTVQVFGTILGSGTEMVAREVVLTVSDEAAEHQH